MGFGFPKDERAALVAAHPEKFFMPIQSDLRSSWVRVWLEAIDQTEMRELVVDAWRMVVPKQLPPSIWVIIPERPGNAVGFGVGDDDYRRSPSDEARLARPTIPARS